MNLWIQMGGYHILSLATQKDDIFKFTVRSVSIRGKCTYGATSRGKIATWVIPHLDEPMTLLTEAYVFKTLAGHLKIESIELPPANSHRRA